MDEKQEQRREPASGTGGKFHTGQFLRLSKVFLPSLLLWHHSPEASPIHS